MATCPNCGNQTGEGAVFCDQCGTRIPQPEAAVPEPAPAPAGGSVICPTCGAGNVPGEAFCDYCGSPLDAPLPDEAEAPAPATTEVMPVVTELPGVEEAEEAAVPAADQEEEAAVCPVCGAEVSADEAFCANCGASLAQAPIPPEPVPEAAPEPEAAPAPEAEAEAAPPAPEAAVAAPPPEPEPAVEEAAPAAPAPAPPAEPAGLNCPACGAEIEPGDVFCSACGFSLQAPAAAPAPAAPAVAPAPAAPPAAAPAPAAGPRLVIAASGAEIPLPAKEEIIVGREDPVSGIYPDVDLTPHGGESGGVSRRHARILVEGGQYFVEDLDSTNFTFVNKQKLAPKTRQVVRQGDEIRFGRVAAVLQTA